MIVPADLLVMVAFGRRRRVIFVRGVAVPVCVLMPVMQVRMRVIHVQGTAVRGRISARPTRPAGENNGEYSTQIDRDSAHRLKYIGSPRTAQSDDRPARKRRCNRLRELESTRAPRVRACEG